MNIFFKNLEHQKKKAEKGKGFQNLPSNIIKLILSNIVLNN